MRRVRATSFQAAGGSTSVDGFFDKIIKYIPSDIVAAWTALTSLIGGKGAVTAGQGGTTTATANNNTVLWIVFIVMTVLAAVWTWHQTRKPGLPPATKQIIAATISFVVWVFALGGPFAAYPFYQNYSYLGGVVLIIWTLVLGLIPPDPDTPAAPPAPPNG